MIRAIRKEKDEYIAIRDGLYFNQLQLRSDTLRKLDKFDLVLKSVCLAQYNKDWSSSNAKRIEGLSNLSMIKVEPLKTDGAEKLIDNNYDIHNDIRISIYPLNDSKSRSFREDNYVISPETIWPSAKDDSTHGSISRNHLSLFIQPDLFRKIEKLILRKNLGELSFTLHTNWRSKNGTDLYRISNSTDKQILFISDNYEELLQLGEFSIVTKEEKLSFSPDNIDPYKSNITNGNIKNEPEKNNNIRNIMISIPIFLGLISIIYFGNSINIRELAGLSLDLFASFIVFIYDAFIKYFSGNWLDLSLNQALFSIVIIFSIFLLSVRTFNNLQEEEDQLLMSLENAANFEHLSLKSKFLENDLNEVLKRGHILTIPFSGINLGIIFFPLSVLINYVFNFSDKWVVPVFFILWIFLIPMLIIPYRNRINKYKLRIKKLASELRNETDNSSD